MARNSVTIKLRCYGKYTQKSRMPAKSVSSGMEHTTTQCTINKNTQPSKVTISNSQMTKRLSANVEQATSTVLCREREYSSIKKRMEAFLAYDAGAVVYITGVPGSGKTYTVTKVLQALNVPYAYINCSKLNSKLGIFSSIGGSLSCRTGCSLQSLRAHFHNCAQHHIIVIDEVDFLRTRNELILYNLFELPFIEHARMLLIVISNTLGSLSSKIESRIGKERIEFRPYSSADLRAILQDAPIISPGPSKDNDPAPLAKGLLRSSMRKNKSSSAKPSAITVPNQKSLELISKRVASSTGDIRKALDILSRAGDAGLQTVDVIIKDINTPLLAKFVRTLCYYQKLILFLNIDCNRDLLAWFNNFKTFCKLKSIPEVDFISFRDVVEDLVSFGMFRMHGLRVSSPYHKEEFELAMRGDETFKMFR